jgi:Arc/MetJ-type ribon-helix-helix transcriptional regulator
MKEVRISLSEELLAAVEAEVASGQFASVSDVVDWALAEYFAQTSPMPSEAEMIAAVAEAEAEIAAGGRLYTADEIREMIRQSLSE